MVKGLPKSIIAKYGITKKAWQIFRGKRTRSSKPTTKTRKIGGRIRTMARRRRRGGGGKSIIQTAFKFIRIGALAAPAASVALSNKTNEQKMNDVIELYTGFSRSSGNWYWESMVKGWTPFVAATLVTYGIPKITGILRRI